MQEQLREREGEARRLALQVEQRKIQEGELQARLAQATEKAKNRERVLEREIEGLKLREKLAVENKQKLQAGVHEGEAQVRRLIADALKRLIEGCCKADTEKVHAAMKGLEASVGQALLASKNQS